MEKVPKPYEPGGQAFVGEGRDAPEAAVLPRPRPDTFFASRVQIQAVQKRWMGIEVLAMITRTR